MVDKIESIFENVAIKYDNMRLYFYGDAINIIDECQKRQIKILGFDSFKLSAYGIQSFMEFSYDYSKLNKSMTWEKARKDIKSLSSSDFVFELVYE